jgi:phage regulator Rha-like protein
VRNANPTSIDTTRATLHPNTFSTLKPDNTLSDDVLESFDKRHAKLLADITGIRRRLDRLASQVS